MSRKSLCIVDQVARESNKSSLSALCVMHIAISLTYLRLLPLNRRQSIVFAPVMHNYAHAAVIAVIMQPCWLPADILATSFTHIQRI